MQRFKTIVIDLAHNFSDVDKADLFWDSLECPSELATVWGLADGQLGGPVLPAWPAPLQQASPGSFTRWQCSESSESSAWRSLNLVSVPFHSYQDPPRLPGGERTLPPPGQGYKVSWPGCG